MPRGRAPLLQLDEPHEGPALSPVYVPPGPKRVSAGAIVRRGPFISIQVNVDEHGMNVLDDAANEPSIAIDPNDPDRMVIGWRQFDTIQSDFRQAGFAWTDDGGRTWTFPGVLTPGTFRSDPVMDADLEGNFYFYNIECASSNCGDLFRSTDGGRTWSGPFFARGGDKVWMVVDRTFDSGRGHVYAAWGQNFIRSRDAGQSFEPPAPVAAMWGTLRVGPDGAVYVVNRAESGSAPVSLSTDAKDPQAVPTFRGLARAPLGGNTAGFTGDSPSPAGILGQPWIDLDESEGPYENSLYVLQSVNPAGLDPLDVRFARSVDGGRTWIGPTRVTDEPVEGNTWQWFGTMSVAPQTGRIDVVWNDTRNAVDYRESELYYAYSTDGGRTFSRNMPLGPLYNSWLGFPVQRKLGDYYHMRSDELGGRLAYAATYNGEQDVYYLHTALDCNDNGFHDGDDVALGRSPDVNENGVPDDCPCDPLESFQVDCEGGRLTARVESSFPQGTELTLFDNGEPAVIVIDEFGRGEVVRRLPARGYHMMDLDGCLLWGQTVQCGFPCANIKRLKVKCRTFKLKAVVKSDLPQGYVVHVVRDGDSRPYEVDERGKIKLVWAVAPGEHTVGVEDCPDFQERVTCG